MLPKVNQFLYLHVASSDEEEAAVEYKSRITDMDNDEVYIDVPIVEGTGKFKRLFLGDELSAHYISNDGVKSYFNTHVLGFKDDGSIKMIRLRKPDPESITTVQRRNFLRVSAELELAIQLAPNVRFIAMTDDVGGGGVSFLADGKWPMKAGTELECWLLLHYRNGTVDHAHFKAEIVRIKPLETGRNQVMVKFTGILDSERQRIIRYCFERQLDFRKR
ncbi:flagellar brake protein [Paenibacillus silvisoli]|uniref:flagellar brake protein n=1 Tax=Paenibacillus silvisoli TaxID=3110539 RepID=UPI0028045B53|nr:flagellar brake domain-containing protein [Paenibacillus silvisoli]